MKKAIKISIIIISVLLILFTIASVFWLVQYNRLIAPMLKNEQLKADDMDASGYKIYNSKGTDYAYQVAAPTFLNFCGNLDLITFYDVDGNGNRLTDRTYSFMYQPDWFFSSGKYSFFICDYTDGSGIGRTYSVYTDKDFNLIGESEEGLYKKYYNELHAIYYDAAIPFFGKDVFR